MIDENKASDLLKSDVLGVPYAVFGFFLGPVSIAVEDTMAKSLDSMTTLIIMVGVVVIVAGVTFAVIQATRSSTESCGYNLGEACGNAITSSCNSSSSNACSSTGLSFFW